MTEEKAPDLEQLALAVGCHRRTLERYRRAGAPWLGATVPLDQWAAAIRTWVEQQRKRQPAPAPTNDGLERSRRALAELRELEVAVRRGELVSRDDVAAEWRRRVLAVRARLLALPRTIAGRCANAPADLIDAEASAIIRDVLLEFAAGGDLTPPPEAGASSVA